MESFLFDIIFDPIHEPVFQFDTHLMIIDCNHAASELLGYAKSDIFHQRITDFVQPFHYDFFPDYRSKSEVTSSPTKTVRVSSNWENHLNQQDYFPYLLSSTKSKNPSFILLLSKSLPAQDETGLDPFSMIRNQACFRMGHLFSSGMPDTALFQMLVDYLAFVVDAEFCAAYIMDNEAYQSAGFFISGNTSLSHLTDPSLAMIHKVITFCSQAQNEEFLKAYDPIIGSAEIFQIPTWMIQSEEKIQIFPAHHQSRCYGLVMVQPPLQNGSTPSFQIEYITLFSQLLAIYLDKKLAIHQEKKQRRQNKVLRELLQMRNTSLEHASVLELILDQLNAVIEFDHASIMLVTNSKVTYAAHRKFYAQEHLDIPLDVNCYPHIQEVLEHKAPVMIKDTRQDDRWLHTPNNDTARCWLGIPLIARDRVLGLLNLDKSQPNYYNEEDIELALIFANQAAVAIENAQLYDFERQRVHQLDLLRSTVAELSSELELSILLRTILERAIEFSGATSGVLGLFDETTQEIVIVTSFNLRKDYKNTRMAIGEGAMGLAVQSRNTINVRDYSHWDNASPHFTENNWHAVIASPLLIGDRVVGAIGITDKNRNRQFSEADQIALIQYAEHAAIAVENAILFMNSQDASEHLMILHQVSQEVVSASLDPEGIYKAVHQAAAKLMPVDAFALTLLDKEKQIIESVYLFDRNGRAPNQIIASSEGLSSLVIQTGESIYKQDMNLNDYQDTVHFGDKERVRSVLAAPMRLRGEVVGMLSTQSYSPNAYKDEDRNLLEMLASYTAIALDNLRLFNEIQKLALTDPLTEIFNRRHLFTLGQREFSRARRLNRPLSVLFIDIDRFKDVNDTYGHKTGDSVLHKIAQVIKSYIREIDILGRYGGEEFVAVLVETTLDDAYLAAERLRVMMPNIFDKDPRFPNLTVSIGVSEMKPTTSSFYHLIDQADTACYQAKNEGRNRVKLYAPEMDHE